jgi:prefoldin subunit 5
MTQFSESALKQYTDTYMDPQKRYSIRRNAIHQSLPDLSGYELQQNIEALNNDLSTLKTDIEECEKAIKELKQGKPTNGTVQLGKTEQLNLAEILHKFSISRSLNVRPEENIDQLRDVIVDRKKTASWIKRERAILLWERRLRKVKALKLPFIRQKVESLAKEDAELVTAVKDHLEQVNQHLDRHQQIAAEVYEQEKQIRKLSTEHFPKANSITPLPAVLSRIDIHRTIKEYLKELKEICHGNPEQQS